MSDIQSPVVGPRTYAEGTQVPLRAGRQGELIAQPAHGEYYEESARGNVWTISTAIGGILATANFGVSVASANAIVGIWNNTTDTNMHITRAVIVQVTGTAVTGGFVWGTLTSPTGITSAGVTGRNNKTFIKGGHKAVAFDGSIAVTGSGVTAAFRYFGGFVDGATSPGALMTLEETETDIVVGPGCFAGLFVVNGLASPNIVGSLSWAEIPA